MLRQHSRVSFLASCSLLFLATACTPEHAAVDSNGEIGEACGIHGDCLAGLRCLDNICTRLQSDAGAVDAQSIDTNDDVMRADASPMDVVGSDQTLADRSQPDSNIADSARPDAFVADHTSPDLSSPDRSMPDVEISTCSLILSPAQSDLGVVAIGLTASTSLSLLATNGPCVLNDVSVSPANPNLYLSGSTRFPLELPAHQALELRFLYAPTREETLDVTVQIHILSTSSTLPVATIWGQAINPQTADCVRFARDTFDFGNIPLACESQRTLWLNNTCDVEKVISRVAIEGGDSFSASIPIPVPLPAGGSLQIAVRAYSTQPGLATARLSAVLDDDTWLASTVNLIANFQDSQTVTESFVQGGNDPVDMLLVIDDSGSMALPQIQLSENIQSILSELTSLDVDYHIGVTTTDMTDSGPYGRFVPLDLADPVITRDSEPNPVERLERAVQVGTYGSATEKGLDASTAALSTQLLATRNADFLRPDAQLAVLYLSDEDDASEQPVSEVFEFIRARKAALGANALSVCAIVGMGPNGCTSDDIVAEEGSRYLELVRLASGTTESICAESWVDVLRRWVRLGTGRRATFFLNADPAGVPRVWVQEQAMQVNVDFTYDSTAHSITFVESSLPRPGDIIEVSYRLACR